MAKIDTSRWKEFHLYDPHMFLIDMGNKFDRVKMDSTVDEVNFVGRTAQNNGVNATCALVSGVDPYPAGCLTLALGGSIGACFVQNRSFYTSQNVIVLKPADKISSAACQFAASVIHKESDLHYQAFSNELNRHIKTDFAINLPATSSGEPDWEYMSDYMTGVLRESSATVDELCNVSLRNRRIGSSTWRSFAISDLFVVQKGTRLTRADMIPGGLPFIGATLENNGITAYIGNRKHVHPGGTLTVAYNGQKAMGKAFWQPKPFWASDDVNVLYPKFELNEQIALFLQPVFWEASHAFSYDDKWNKAAMEQTTLTLPVVADGSPDWEYMQCFMQHKIDEADTSITQLEEL